MNDLLLGRYNVDQYLGLDAVERIELIRGPASPLYGTGALVGVVNIITRRGRDVDGTRLKYQGGPYTQEASLTWGQLLGDWDVLFNFTFRDQKGQEIDQPAEKDFVDPKVLPQATKMPGKVYWRRYPQNFSGILDVRTDDASIALRGAHFQRVTPRGANGSFYVYDQEPLRPTFTENDFFADYKKSWTFGATEANKITFNPAVHHFAYYEQSFLNFGANRQPPYGSRSGTLAEMNNYQVKVTYDRTVLDSVSGTAGFDGLLASMYRTDRFNIVNIPEPPGQAVVITPQGYAPSGHWSVVGLFGQAVWSPIRSLAVTAGARYDVFLFADKADAHLTPRLGLVYRPRNELALKLLYGESYLAPEYGHRLSNDPEFVGNKNLAPETFRGGDLIALYQQRWLALMGDVYINRVDRLINAVMPGTAGGSGSYQNSGPSLYLGFDSSAEAQVTPWLRLGAGYSLIRSAHDDVPGVRTLVDHGDILDIPRHTVRYSLRVDPPQLRGLTGTVWGRLTTDTKTIDSVLLPPPSLTRVPAVFLIDTCLVYTWSRLTLQLLATNILDTYYERGGTLPRPLARNGFMVEASVAYRF
jgi:outer membrane receptor protein involved in Fe transport